MGKKIKRRPGCGIGGAPDRKVMWNNLLYAVDGETIGRARSPDRAGAVRKQKIRAIPHNSKCRYGERGAAAAKPKAQIILDAAKVSAASGGNSEPKQGQRSQSARGFCPRSTMRVPQPDIIEHFGNADAVPQPPERCLSRKAGIVRCCHKNTFHIIPAQNAADDTSNNNNTFAALLQRGAARPKEKRQNKNPPVVRTGG